MAQTVTVTLTTMEISYMNKAERMFDCPRVFDMVVFLGQFFHTDVAVQNAGRRIVVFHSYKTSMSSSLTCLFQLDSRSISVSPLHLALGVVVSFP